MYNILIVNKLSFSWFLQHPGHPHMIAPQPSMAVNMERHIQQTNERLMVSPHTIFLISSLLILMLHFCQVVLTIFHSAMIFLYLQVLLQTSLCVCVCVCVCVCASSRSVSTRVVI